MTVVAAELEIDCPRQRLWGEVGRVNVTVRDTPPMDALNLPSRFEYSEARRESHPIEQLGQAYTLVCEGRIPNSTFGFRRFRDALVYVTARHSPPPGLDSEWIPVFGGDNPYGYFPGERNGAPVAWVLSEYRSAPGGWLSIWGANCSTDTVKRFGRIELSTTEAFQEVLEAQAVSDRFTFEYHENDVLAINRHPGNERMMDMLCFRLEEQVLPTQTLEQIIFSD